MTAVARDEGREDPSRMTGAIPGLIQRCQNGSEVTVLRGPSSHGIQGVPPCMLPPSQLIQVKILYSKSRVGLLKERIITSSYWYKWCISCCSHLKSDFYGTKSNPRLISIVSKPIGFVIWSNNVLIKKNIFFSQNYFLPKKILVKENF